jgi:alkanesulfonate monooxygenase SsuD/methylene tetrahydromethanopterin reductase-like flavin-dependent oxidoreductase (luciferase family)
MPYLLPLSRVRSTVEGFRAKVRAAGRADDSVRIASLIVTMVVDGDDTAEKSVRHHLALYLGSMGPHYAKFVSSQGYAPEVRTVLEYWRAGDRVRAAGSITDEMLRDLAVIGSPSQVLDGLSQHQRAGVDAAVIVLPRGLEFSSVLDTLKALASAHANDHRHDSSPDVIRAKPS